MSNFSIWSTNRALSSATTPDQSGPVSDGNKEVLRVPQGFTITGVSPSDWLMSCPGHSLEESYPSPEMKSVYSAALAEWATGHSLDESYFSAEMQSVYFTPPVDWTILVLVRQLKVANSEFKQALLCLKLTFYFILRKVLVNKYQCCGGETPVDGKFNCFRK